MKGPWVIGLTWSEWGVIGALLLGVLGLTAVVQSFLARPRLELDFVRERVDKDRILLAMKVVNRPVGKKLRWLATRDTALRVDVGFRVLEYEGDNNLAGGIVNPAGHSASITGGGELRSPFALHPGEPILAQCIVWQRGAGGHIVIPDQANQPIERGTYRVDAFTHERAPGRLRRHTRYVSLGPDSADWGKVAKTPKGRIEITREFVVRGP